jgi:transmembrane sensor
MHPNPVDTKISDEAIDWFSKFSSGLASSEDYKRFEVWRKQSSIHGKAYADVEKFWASLDEPALRVSQQKNPLPNSKYTGSAATRHTRRGQWLLGGHALAAALAMVFWLLCILHFGSADYRVRWGETKEIVLADHSLLTLNTHSAVSVDFSPEPCASIYSRKLKPASFKLSKSTRANAMNHKPVGKFTARRSSLETRSQRFVLSQMA